MFQKRQIGFTLIELLVSTVVISIGVIGVLLASSMAVRHSGDSLIAHQAIAIAESYMEEIAQKAFPASVPCPGTPGADRTTYSSICDYNGLNQVPTDATNTAIAGLGGYNVTVTITSNTAALGISAANIVRIDVTVTSPSSINLPTTVSMYRTNYS